MSHSLILLGLFILVGLYAFFMLADYGWERRKLRGFDPDVPEGEWSEARQYAWYSWIRYLAVILLTYINAIAIIESRREQNEGLQSPLRMLWLFCIVVLFSVALVAIDGYWERYRLRGLNNSQTALFWSYFWLRYPALIFITIQLTTRGLH